jgi:hypothetical protein
MRSSVILLSFLAFVACNKDCNVSKETVAVFHNSTNQDMEIRLCEEKTKTSKPFTVIQNAAFQEIVFDKAESMDIPDTDGKPCTGGRQVKYGLFAILPADQSGITRLCHFEKAHYKIILQGDTCPTGWEDYDQSTFPCPI